MQYKKLNIEGLVLFEPTRIEDNRGYFCETFRVEIFEKATKSKANFLQENHSFTESKGTVRGLHYQSPPYAQGKLIRCTRGKILDIALDARPKSKSYGQYFSTILSGENGALLWIPEGFLHGFSTMTNDCEVSYKLSNYYSEAHAGSVYWADKNLGIDWNISSKENVIVSEKDKNATSFLNWENPF